jgi:hypothetical protein
VTSSYIWKSSFLSTDMHSARRASTRGVLRALSTCLVALLLLTACSDDEDDRLVIEFEVSIPPAGEVFWCYFGTFEEEIGINGLWGMTESHFLHHQLMKPVLEDEPYEDGEIADCLTLGEWWGPAPTLLEGVGERDPDDEDREINLPDGVAYVMEAGQRYVVDSHWINTTDEEQTGRVEMELGFVSMDQVEHRAGTFNLDKAGLSIPPGTWTEQFDCEISDDSVNILQIGPHMHTHGSHYGVDIIRGDGSIDPVFEIEEWKPEYREEPPMWNWGPGELVVHPGDKVRTRCTWENPYDENLEFPEEMCTSFGAGFPMDTDIFCGGSGTMNF